MEKAILKVQRLLALAGSDNVHEAASAARAAQEIMDKHNITQMMLAEPGFAKEEEIIDFLKKENKGLDFFQGAKAPDWKKQLANVVAKANGCRIYVQPAGNDQFLALVGRQEDGQAVIHLYSFLVKELDRLCERDSAQKDVFWKESYLLGAITQIKKVLGEARFSAANEVLAESASGAGTMMSLAKAVAGLEERGMMSQRHMENVVPSLKQSTEKFLKATQADAMAAGKKAASEINLKNKRLKGMN